MAAVNHEEASDLLAVYALDAVPRDQKEALEAHVSTCDVCARTLAEHRETAALLAQVDEPEPSGQWENIAAAIEGGGDAPAEVVSLARRRAVRGRLLVAVGGHRAPRWGGVPRRTGLPCARRGRDLPTLGARR
jgi:hypothetical protein